MSRKTVITLRPRHNCDARIIGWKVTEPIPGTDAHNAVECTSKAEAEKSLELTVRNRVAEGYGSIEIKSYNHDNQLVQHATYKVASSGTVTLEEHKVAAAKAKPVTSKSSTAAGDGYTPAQRAALHAASVAPAAAPKAAKPRVRKAKAEAAAPAAAAATGEKPKGLAKYQRFVKKFKKANPDASKEQVSAAWNASKGSAKAPAAKAAKAAAAPKAAAKAKPAKAAAAAAAPADAKPVNKGLLRWQKFNKSFKKANPDASREQVKAAYDAKYNATATTTKAPKTAKAAAKTAKAAPAAKAPAAATAKTPKAGTKAAEKAAAKAAKAEKKAAKDAKPKRELSPAMAARNKWVQKRIPQLKAAGMDHKAAFGQAQREYSAAHGK